MSRRTAAREAVIRAVLRVLTAERAEPHERSDDDAWERDDRLALAARELVAATDQLPAGERPAGWGDSPAVTPHPTLRRPDGGPVVLDEVLATPLGLDGSLADDPGADTVRGYLMALLARLWEEGGNFSSKRPFGDSGWRWDLYPALERAGYVAGVMDERGYVRPDADPADRNAYDALILAAINYLGAA